MNEQSDNVVPIRDDCPEWVKANPAAYAEWKLLMPLLRKIEDLAATGVTYDEALKMIYRENSEMFPRGWKRRSDE